MRGPSSQNENSSDLVGVVGDYSGGAVLSQMDILCDVPENENSFSYQRCLIRIVPRSINRAHVFVNRARRIIVMKTYTRAMTTLKARFDGRVLVPEEPVDLPVNEVLEIQIVGNDAPAPENDVASKTEVDNAPLAGLQELLAGLPSDPDTPTDLAAQHRSLSSRDAPAFMIFADTGFFIAQLQPRDALHERALKWAQRDTMPLLTTEYVLSEVADALSAPATRARLHTFLPFLYQAKKMRNLARFLCTFSIGLAIARRATR